MKNGAAPGGLWGAPCPSGRTQVAPYLHGDGSRLQDKRQRIFGAPWGSLLGCIYRGIVLRCGKGFEQSLSLN
jgi:hypothetical protein